VAQPLTWIAEAAAAEKRSRYSWNERITHWERPPSDHEESKIQRAAVIATNLVKGNARLVEESVEILPQGSYYNNTNVRLEADMDLRVQLPVLMVRYASGIPQEEADRSLHYISTGRSLPQIAREVRDSLAADCRRTFGASNVSVGNKAVSVDGLDGSHADVDLVPAFHLHYVFRDADGAYRTIEGVGISGADGSETWNFPEQHHANGIAKRANTAHRFKKVVRALKRLNYELCDLGAINRRMPSFMVECLVYLAEDRFFLVDEDDRYGRLLRVVLRISELLSDDKFAEQAHEINDVKYLFHHEQAWTLSDARNFLSAAIARLVA
jgi:hypothetical protein